MNKRNLTQVQNEEYKNGTYKSRAVKLEIAQKDKIQFNFIFPLYNLFSKKVFKDLKGKRLRLDTGELITIENLDPLSMADHVYVKEVAEIQTKNEYNASFIKRSIVKQVLERYRSYIKRNKKMPFHPIIFKNDRNFQIYSGCVKSIDIKNKKININFYYEDDPRNISLDYSSVGNMVNLEKYLKGGGGYIIFSNRKNKKRIFFVPRAKIPVDWRYQPKKFIGYDMNKSKETFMVFSEKIKFAQRKIDVISKKSKLFHNIVFLEGELKKANEGIRKALEEKNRKLRKRLKTKARLSVIEWHDRLEKAYEEIAKDIVEGVVQQKACLCIDYISPGAKHGSFGQDKMIGHLVKLCENNSVPFVLVPSAYTTRICNKCGHMHGKIDVRIRNFVCSNCNSELARDKNSALNVAKQGKDIWELGIPEANKRFKETYKETFLKHS